MCFLFHPHYPHPLKSELDNLRKLSPEDKLCFNPFLTLTTVWADLADDTVMTFFLFFPENRIWQFMQTVS